MSSININPLAGSNNRVVVKPADAEEKSAGGIIILILQKKNHKGHVMAVSEKDDKGVAPVVKNGDTVLYQVRRYWSESRWWNLHDYARIWYSRNC